MSKTSVSVRYYSSTDKVLKLFLFTVNNGFLTIVFFYEQASHYERRISTLELQLRESQKSHRKALEEASSLCSPHTHAPTPSAPLFLHPPTPLFFFQVLMSAYTEIICCCTTLQV
jgi:hypothetical protein